MKEYCFVYFFRLFSWNLSLFTSTILH